MHFVSIAYVGAAFRNLKETLINCVNNSTRPVREKNSYYI